MLVGEKFDAGVGEDAKEGCRMSAKEAPQALLAVYVTHGSDNAKPRTRIFGELRVRGLEEDLDAIKGADDGFCLEEWSV